MASESTYRPFESFLSGYLEGAIGKIEIEVEAGKLQQSYLEYVESKKGRLDWMARELHSSFRKNRFDIPERLMFSNWDSAHLKFAGRCLEAAYELVRKSNLKDRGFLLSAPPADLAARFHTGMEEHCRVLEKESQRITGENSAHLF